MSIDRRSFLRRAGLGATAAGVAAAGLAPSASAQSSLPPIPGVTGPSIPAPFGDMPGAAAGVPIGTVVDYAAGPPPAAAVRANGHLGAVRYCSNRRPGADFMTGKPLRSGEVDDYRANGLTMVSCYQFGKGETSDWRGGAGAGDFHAPIGIGIHFAAAGPRNVPMYVAIDDNPSYWEFDNLIAPYLDRFRGRLAAEGLRLGVYANAPTIDWCLQRGLGEYFWQHDWGSAGRLNPAANIHQKAGKAWRIAGVDCDVNDVYTLDFGQWWISDPIAVAQAAFAGSSR